MVSKYVLVFVVLGVLIVSGCTQQTDLPKETSAEDQTTDISTGESEEVEPADREDIGTDENLEDEDKPVETEDIEASEDQEEVEEIVKVNIPTSVESSCIGFLTAIPEEVGTVNTVGAGWTRPHSGPFSWGAIETSRGRYDFSVTDEYVEAAQENNVAILATIWPFAKEGKNGCKVSEQDQFYPRDPVGRLGIPEYRCKPSNMEAYKNFLSTLVERYDGDGVEDMSGLEIPIKYWEVLNEPELKSPTLTFFVGDEDDYLEVLKESYQTIKQVCGDCKVLHGGAAGASPEFLSFWENVFKAGGGNYFDIANIHSISSEDVSDLNVGSFRSLLNKYKIKKPIWVTEVEFKNPTGDVKASTQKALGVGAEKIFFVSFQVGGHSPTQGKYSSKYKEALDLCQ